MCHDAKPLFLDAAAVKVRSVFGAAGAIVVLPGGKWGVGAIEDGAIRLFGRGADLSKAVDTAERTLEEIADFAERERLNGRRRTR